MKVRLTPPGDTQGVWLTAGRSAAGAFLIAVTVSACTGGGSSVPTIFTPSVQTPPSSQTHAGTRTPSPTGQGSRPPGTPAHTATTGHAGASASAHAASPAHTASSPQATSTSHAASPTHTASTPHATASSHASAPASATAAPSSTVRSSTPRATHKSAPAPAFPTAAPETGGGGTAGLQDGLLFGVGGLAVLAGMGSLVYRRRLARKLREGEPVRQSPPDREPADR